MSVGEMPELPEDATATQERGLIHLHMLSGQYRTEEADAGGEEKYELLMGEALAAEHQATAARLKGQAKASLLRSVRGRALESRYSVVLQARDSVLPGYVRDAEFGARALAQIRKRRRVEREEDE